MKIYIFGFLITLMLVLSVKSIAQEIIYNNDDNQTITNSVITDDKNETNNQKHDPKISYHLEMGSVFSSTKSYGNSLSFYTAPELKYKLAPKINISAGIILINTSISNYYINNHNKSGNFKNAYFFSGFEYQANQKLILSGDILYGTNKSPYNFDNTNKKDFYLRFSAEYKINNNLSIGLQVINQNMGYGRYGNSFGYDPFGNGLRNPFDR